MKRAQKDKYGVRPQVEGTLLCAGVVHRLFLGRCGIMWWFLLAGIIGIPITTLFIL